MYLTHCWASLIHNTTKGFQKLNDEISRLDFFPDDVIVVSAGEVSLFLDAEVREFLSRLEKSGKRVSFVGAACTSMHAAILAFARSDAECASILVLEVNSELQQACLNAVGVGLLDEQDGLKVTTGIGLLCLEKQKSERAKMKIIDCRILAQNTGIQSAQLMLSSIRNRIQNLPPNTKNVSFAIHSRWSSSLLEGIVEHKNWLNSLEEQQNHLLSLKPIFEILEYSTIIDESPLHLITLGGGGRVGCLLITNTDYRGQSRVSSVAFNNCFQFPLVQDTLLFCRLYLNANRLHPEDFHQKLKALMKYPSVVYRGIDDHYFEWRNTLGWEAFHQAISKELCMEYFDTEAVF